MGVEIVRRLSLPTLWIAHREELIEQAAHAMEKTGLLTGIIKAGSPAFALAPIQVASLQTLARRLDSLPPCGLVGVDECHHAASESYRKVFEALGNTPCFGLTATPFRLDGKPLNTCFKELVVAAYPDELVEQGYLVNPKVFVGQVQADLSGVKITAGDYNAKQLESAVMDGALIGDIVQTWLRLANGKKTICFATSIEHSQCIVRQFISAGVNAIHVDAQDVDNQRSLVCDLLRSGKVQVVSNCMLFTEGWDLPELECAILARPTASLALHLQMLGRIMRSAHGKDGAIVLDHAGNHDIHGFATTRLAYSLDGKVKRDEESLGLRTCPKCFVLFLANLTVCPECGAVIEKAKSDGVREIKNKKGELVEFDEWRMKQRFYERLTLTATVRGYSPRWTSCRYHEKFNEWPLIVGGVLVNPEKASYFEKMTAYHDLLLVARERGFADGWASHKYKNIFGSWPTGFVGSVKNALEPEIGHDREADTERNTPPVWNIKQTETVESELRRSYL